MKLDDLLQDERARRAAFPVTEAGAFLAHAGVAPLPATARDAIRRFADEGAAKQQEGPWFGEQVKRARRLAGQLIGASEQEIALLGPTSLGLNLVARGIDWQAGDQVIYYEHDYPANVYCWMDLQRAGVEPIAIRTADLPAPGVITWEAIEPLLTDRTRLVSLATCHFVTGWRIDYRTIGRKLHERGILLCLDAIQTLGAFPMDVEHVDFLAADSHKWMLGPIGAGFFYVKKSHMPTLWPALLGSWNVVSPEFIAQDEIDFYPGGRRYEPGTLNGPGIAGMAASLELLLEVGVEAIADRLRTLRRHLLEQVRPLGYEPIHDLPDDHASAIVTLRRPRADLKAVFDRLAEAGITASLRHGPDGQPALRFSPHFYNTFEELDRAAARMKA